MTSPRMPSPSRRATLHDAKGPGLAGDPPPGLPTRHADLRVDGSLRMVLASASWRAEATLGRSYPGRRMPPFDDRPRASRLGPPPRSYGPHVLALERELQSTRRELRQALLALRTPGAGAESVVEPAMARDGRSRTARGDRGEASENGPTTLRGTAAADGPQHADAVAAAATPDAPRGRLPTTRHDGAEPARRFAPPLGPTVDEPAAIDDTSVGPSPRRVFVVVDDDLMDAILDILRAADMEATRCASGEAFLRADRRGSEACLLTASCVAGVGGLDLVDRLRAAGSLMPAVVITGHGDVPMAVRAMRAGVSDVIEEPVEPGALLTCVARALERAGETTRRLDLRGDAARHVAGLTPRQREIMASVLAGHPSKNIAADLGISRRTVENHRASIMRKMGTRSLPALARLALAAEPTG